VGLAGCGIMDPGAATGSEKEGFAGPDSGEGGGGAAKGPV